MQIICGRASQDSNLESLAPPRDGGAWWAAIYGVAQSQTQLKRLSSSSRARIPVWKVWLQSPYSKQLSYTASEQSCNLLPCPLPPPLKYRCRFSSSNPFLLHAHLLPSSHPHTTRPYKHKAFLPLYAFVHHSATQSTHHHLSFFALPKVFPTFQTSVKFIHF